TSYGMDGGGWGGEARATVPKAPLNTRLYADDHTLRDRIQLVLSGVVAEGGRGENNSAQGSTQHPAIRGRSHPTRPNPTGLIGDRGGRDDVVFAGHTPTRPHP